ncbi:hypothetical protein Sfulv_26020 [Streptomyces fulvorobeus]|uniref:Uncharacterized protein n=1 Tax=Streptomyces fulvorobeus TaxID=284028 RepID=A0A7J0C5M2_9ACTN|nr:hypothetical protein Sfulv_26020 [Streptomyces fulvorobeus]
MSAAVAMAATGLWGAGSPAAARPVVPAVAPGLAPEADVSHHGHVSLWEDRLGVRLESANSGPWDLADVTVRLRFSAPLAGSQGLPQGCLRGGRSTVLCRMGPLPADGEIRRAALDLRLGSRPAEVVMRVDTVWSGGVRDRAPRNNEHEVLAPATGDAYAF